MRAHMRMLELREEDDEVRAVSRGHWTAHQSIHVALCCCLPLSVRGRSTGEQICNQIEYCARFGPRFRCVSLLRLCRSDRRKGFRGLAAIFYVSECSEEVVVEPIHTRQWRLLRQSRRKCGKHGSLGCPRHDE